MGSRVANTSRRRRAPIGRFGWKANRRPPPAGRGRGIRRHRHQHQPLPDQNCPPSQAECRRRRRRGAGARRGPARRGCHHHSRPWRSRLGARSTIPRSSRAGVVPPIRLRRLPRPEARDRRVAALAGTPRPGHPALHGSAPPRHGRGPRGRAARPRGRRHRVADAAAVGDRAGAGGEWTRQLSP